MLSPLPEFSPLPARDAPFSAACKFLSTSSMLPLIARSRSRA